MKKSKSKNKEIIDIWKKFGDNEIISDIIGIPEEFVNDYVEFNKIPKNIKNMIGHPYSLLRYNELIRLISRTTMFFEKGIQKKLKKSDKDTTKLFNSIFKQFLENSSEPLIHRSAQKIMVSKNNGKLCPECNSKKQAEKINVIELIQDAVLKAAELISKKIYVESEPEYDPVWKCVDCGYEWRGALITVFLDSDQI